MLLRNSLEPLPTRLVFVLYTVFHEIFPCSIVFGYCQLMLVKNIILILYVCSTIKSNNLSTLLRSFASQERHVRLKESAHVQRYIVGREGRRTNLTPFHLNNMHLTINTITVNLMEF